MWLYVFGSTVRGEVDQQSDVDVLAVIESKSEKIKLPKTFLVYSKTELAGCFARGDLFSHHLALESRLMHSCDGVDVIQDLGAPAAYRSGADDFQSFCEIAESALRQLRSKSNCLVFEYGVLYMALRDAAMILSYHEGGRANFSKYAPFLVTQKLKLAASKYELLKRCRATSTRGLPSGRIARLSDDDLDIVEDWLKSAGRVLHERLQIEDRVAAQGA